MVYQPIAGRHRSRIAYAFGLLALFSAATTLIVVVYGPALSSTQLSMPVPAPEITVADEDSAHGYEVDPYTANDDFAEAAIHRAVPTEVPSTDGGPAADKSDPLAGPPSPEDVRRSLFWSGIFGLAISLAGLGLVGVRRRMW